MDILDALLNRRSIRRYTGEKISEEQIEILIKAAMYAPSAVNKQPWHYIVFDDPVIIDKIVEVHPNSGMLKQASHGILICWDEQLQHDKGYGPVDCSAATQNMLLAAYGIGLGAVWVGIYPRDNRIEALHKLFMLPPNIIPFSIVSVGFPAEKREMPNRFQPNRIHWDRW